MVVVKVVVVDISRKIVSSFMLMLILFYFLNIEQVGEYIYKGFPMVFFDAIRMS